MLRIINNLTCSIEMSDERLYPLADNELRALIADAKKKCPENSRLYTMRINVNETSCEVVANYRGTIRASLPRRSTPVVKPDRYTLYSAAELLKLKTKNRFYNTWMTCSICHQSEHHATAKINGKWICEECFQKRLF